MDRLASFAAVISVVTQRSSPLTAVSGEERCVTTLITAAKETTELLALERNGVLVTQITVNEYPTE